MSTIVGKNDHETLLDSLVAQGDLKSYRRVINPTQPEDWDDLLILEFSSGTVLHVKAFSMSSEGCLGLRIVPKE